MNGCVYRRRPTDVDLTLSVMTEYLSGNLLQVSQDCLQMPTGLPVFLFQSWKAPKLVMHT